MITSLTTDFSEFILKNMGKYFQQHNYADTDRIVRIIGLYGFNRFLLETEKMLTKPRDNTVFPEDRPSAQDCMLYFMQPEIFSEITHIDMEYFQANYVLIPNYKVTVPLESNILNKKITI